MNSRKPENANGIGINGTRDEVRELAESLSLFRSAMHHIAEHETSRPAPALTRSRYTWVLLQPALLAPVLATAIFLAALPVYQHFRHAQHPVLPGTASSVSAATEKPEIADAELMTQIDAAVSEDVPDALQPMADFGSASSSKLHSSSALEKNHVTQE